MPVKIAFIDRDGTIVKEPDNFQVDRLDKISFVEDIFWALNQLQSNGYQLVMVTNQDALGSANFPWENFNLCHDFIMKALVSQGIHFSDVKICPHAEKEGCICRKPKTELIKEFLPKLDYEKSFVVGDRLTDKQLADNIGIQGFVLNDSCSWQDIIRQIVTAPREGQCVRKTNETAITATVSLDGEGRAKVSTGNGFFDHMLEQLAKHSGISLSIECQGDLHIDDHHTVEDVGLALGQALAQALGDRRGINRYGFLLPMDETLAQVAIDLGGRPFFVFNGSFPRNEVGGLATEMIPHFFRSLIDPLRASLNMQVTGENTHHMVEALFKSFARALGDAVAKKGTSLPSTKGLIV